jgi:hypothetical protein
MPREIQVIRRGCCNTIFAGCVVEAIDKEWIESVEDAIKKGHWIQNVKPGTWKFSPCVCNEIDPNQLNLF